MAEPFAVEGTADLIKQLRNIGGLDNGKALRNSVLAGMSAARAEARNRIPVGTRRHKTYTGRYVSPGFARKSLRIITQLSPDKQKATAMLGVRKEAYYVVQFIEIGTSKYAAHPWLRPSFYSSQDRQLDNVKISLQSSITALAAK